MRTSQHRTKTSSWDKSVMSRQSVYPHDGRGSRPSVFIDQANLHATQRQSYAPNVAAGAGAGSAAAMARLQAKRQELEGLMMLKEQSARLARDVEKLGDNVDELVEGGEAVAAVMTSWSGVFRAMQIARDSLAARAGMEQGEEASLPKVPETLVRLPVDSGETTEATE